MVPNNPIEFISQKAQEAAATTQNLTEQAVSTVQDSANQVVSIVQEAPGVVVGAATIVSQEALKVAHHLKFENLPSNLQFKFARAGMRQGYRNVQEAAKVFETIPAQIRAQGAEAIREFCQDKDWSHIKAYVNGGGHEAANGIFEHFWVNRARGGMDMTPEELAAARKVLADAAFKAAVAEIVESVIEGAILAAALEFIFATLENSLLVIEGKITQQELVQRVTVATVKAGIAAGVITGILMAICMVFPPIAQLLAVVSVPLAIAGIGLMSIRAWEIFCHADQIFGITATVQKLLIEAEPTMVG